MAIIDDIKVRQNWGEKYVFEKEVEEDRYIIGEWIRLDSSGFFTITLSEEEMSTDRFTIKIERIGKNSCVEYYPQK